MLRWLWDNKGSLLLSFALAVTVWVASVVAVDPTIEGAMEDFVPVNYTEPDEGLVVVGSPPAEARVTIKAPESVWQEISLETISITVDLSGLDPAIYRLELVPDHSNLKPLRIISVEPEFVRVKLEHQLSQEMPVTVRLIGDPALTYDVGEPIASPARATVIGPTSLVSEVVEIRAEVSLAGASQDIDEFIPLVAVDESGEIVEGVEISPDPVGVFVPITQGDRYRLLSVIPDLFGSPAFGYRIIAFTVIPNEVLVTSSDLTALDNLAGFLDTETIDITGATETVDQNVLLDLPEAIFPVQDQTVRVIVTIEPIETSKTFPDLPFEIQGLAPGLAALPSPDRVTLLLQGPLAILEELQAEDILVVLNLIDFEIGVYEGIVPEVVNVPEGISIEEIAPPTVDIEVIIAPPATPTPSS